MPFPTPFHPRTQALCTSYAWKTWAGYYAVRHYDASPEREYNAVRQGAGLLDITPLFKLDVSGKDAGAFLDYVLCKSVAKMKVGRVAYVPWTDDDGKVLDDGTCWRLDKTTWRITSASPSWAWFERNSRGFDVRIIDQSDRLAALALQGPTSRAVLVAAGADVAELKFFGWQKTKVGDAPVWVSRTGYTGDLGYEIWVENAHALAVWDRLMQAGKPHGIWPIGLDTLDIARIEAGFILQGNDYHAASDALTPANKSSPFEIGLAWTLDLERETPFIGQRALLEEKKKGSMWAFVGLVIDWPSIEAAFARHDLPPSLPTAAWRAKVPLYRGMRQVGYASSGVWSGTLKKNLALGSVFTECEKPGTELDIELLVDWERTRVPAVVTKLPFFDPPRKRA